MDRSVRPIKCSICGYEFKTEVVTETRYEGYDPYEVEVAYPSKADKNPPHLVKNYVCDRCYSHMGDVIKDKLIKDGKDYCESFKEREERLRIEYEFNLNKLNNEIRGVSKVISELQNLKTLSDMSEELKYAIEKTYSRVFDTYYLSDAINIDREQVKQEFSLWSYCNKYGIEIKEYPYKDKESRYSSFDRMKPEDFYKLLPDCVIANSSINDMLRLLDRVRIDIDKGFKMPVGKRRK